tara:strand:- start:331 stop:513 length:183 start_codon:yes stop_codon:yes gene_type:complete
MCKKPLAHAPRPIKTSGARIAKLRRGLQDIVDVDALDSSGQWSTPAKMAREVLEEDDEHK